MDNLITYKISSDLNGKLKNAAKLSCGFWNKFVIPNANIVIRLGTFYRFGNTIARAYKPYVNEGVTYGRIEFNTRFLKNYHEDQTTGTIIHEIGHTLGFGWEKWMTLFDNHTGKFLPEAIERLPSLADIMVETDYGPGTTLSHWDEQHFGSELMTGFKNSAEYVLPVTIDVTELLGHKVVERLSTKKSLFSLIDDVRNIQFSKKDEAKKIDRDYLTETAICEEIYSTEREKAL